MDLTHNAASVTVTELLTNKGKQYKNPNDVDFIVKYPEGYGGVRHMPEGLVVISKEAAEKFTQLGIGSISEDADAVESDTNVQEPVNYSKLNKDQLKAELVARGIEFDETSTKAVLLDLLVASDKKPGVSEDADAVAS